MNTKSRKRPLFVKIVGVNLVVTCSVLIIAMLLGIYSSLAYMRQDLDVNISNLSYTLAHTEIVIKALESPVGSEEEKASLESFLDGVLENAESIDVITVADMNSVRLFHPEKERIGELFIGGDENQFEEGKDQYIVFGTGTLGPQQRAFTRVRNKDGEPIGFVMVSALTDSIAIARVEIIKHYLLLAVIPFLLTVAAAFFIARMVKKALFGYEPAQFANMFVQRKEVLDGLEEGILAIDEKGIVVLSNESALNMINARKRPAEGHHIKKVFPQSKLLDVLESKEVQYNQELELSDRTLLASRIPLVEKNGQVEGVVSIFRDKSEVTKMAEELTGSRHLVEALRSNMHEFKNKLHIILGLIQLGEIEAAGNYITEINQEQEALGSIINHIENKTLAALISGKINSAREQGVSLALNKDSILPAHNKFLSVQQLVTILGNLLENAIESTVENEGEKEIELLVYCTEDGIDIKVWDNGSGMSEESRLSAVERGYSTKGEGRGIGLSLVKNIIDARDGQLGFDLLEDGRTQVHVSVRKVRK